MEPFDLLARLGLKIFEVEDLDRDVVFVENEDLGFVRAGLSPDDRQWVADWLLSAAADALIGHGPA